VTILILQNHPAEGLGLHEQYLLDRHIDHRIVPAWADEPLPDPAGFEAVIVGGTPICVRESAKHAFLARERAWLERLVESHGNALGICFGAQLLASILGADVRRNPVMEIGGYELWLTEAGRADPLLAHFPAAFPVFHWHGDTFDIPPGASHLVAGESCPHQMFRSGGIIGLQFHIEITVAQAARWTVEYAHELPEAGKTAGQVVAECRSRQPAMDELAVRFMDNWLASLG